jgi:hypothetical protein
VKTLMRVCWQEDPQQRPVFHDISTHIANMMLRLEIERPFERVTRGTRRSNRSAFDRDSRTTSGSSDPFETPIVSSTSPSSALDTFSMYSSRSSRAYAPINDDDEERRRERDERRKEVARRREGEVEEKKSSVTSSSSSSTSSVISQRAKEVKAFFMNEPEIPISPVTEMVKPTLSSSPLPHPSSVPASSLNLGLGLGLGFGVDVPLERGLLSDGEIEVVGVVNEGDEKRMSEMDGALQECDFEEEEEMVKNALHGREYSWVDKSPSD